MLESLKLDVGLETDIVMEKAVVVRGDAGESETGSWAGDRYCDGNGRICAGECELDE